MKYLIFKIKHFNNLIIYIIISLIILNNFIICNVTNIKQKCSRSNSKLVREYFVRVLLPIYKRHSLPVPEKCPFSPLHDMYHYQENNKTKLDDNKWKCEICGKYFLSEDYLDNHFDRKHNDTLQKVFFFYF